MVEQPAAGVGQAELPAFPVDEAAADFGFKLGDALGDGGLGGVKAQRRAAEAAEIGDPDEGLCCRPLSFGQRLPV